MKSILSILVLVISLGVATNALSATGDLQVICEPGVLIYVDGELKGTTNEFDNGLFVEGLSVGSHTLRAVKEKYEDKIWPFKVSAFKTTPLKIEFDELKERVKQLQPESDETLAKVGNLELRSNPFGVDVFVDGVNKGKTDLLIENVLIGNHKIKFKKAENVLAGRFYLGENETLKLKAHFKKNRIINVSNIERKEQKRQAELERQEAVRKRKQEEERRRAVEKRSRTARERRRAEIISKAKDISKVKITIALGERVKFNMNNASEQTDSLRIFNIQKKLYTSISSCGRGNLEKDGEFCLPDGRSTLNGVATEILFKDWKKPYASTNFYVKSGTYEYERLLKICGAIFVEGDCLFKKRIKDKFVFTGGNTYDILLTFNGKEKAYDMKFEENEMFERELIDIYERYIE